MNSLGFCCSYDETQLFESSLLAHPQQNVYNNAYTQFVFDNADHNVNTIDGQTCKNYEKNVLDNIDIEDSSDVDERENDVQFNVERNMLDEDCVSDNKVSKIMNVINQFFNK